jgi:biotin carboxyl carrier protein
MKKYITNLADSAEKNEIEFTGADSVRVNNKDYTFNYKFITDKVLMLRLNDKNYFMTLSESDDEEEYLSVNLQSKLYNIVVKSELDIMIEKMSVNKSQGKDKKEIFSPMPGIITKLNVTEGQKVNKGDVILVLEAMKMENEIKAKKDCVIKKINAEALKSVEKNELLVILE